VTGYKYLRIVSDGGLVFDSSFDYFNDISLGMET
jgi:hypothetical protein